VFWAQTWHFFNIWGLKEGRGSKVHCFAYIRGKGLRQILPTITYRQFEL
jgi:hypothetical protein